MNDLKVSLRTLRKTPGFTLVAVLVLALGIGANTAMFSVVNALTLKPLPGQAGRLVGIFDHDRTNPGTYRAFSYPNYLDIRGRDRVFAALTAYTFSLVGLQEGDGTRRAFAAIVASNYFSTLDVPLAAGRAFTADEERPGASIASVVVGHDRWRRSGFDPSFVGSTVRINARTFTIVGVAPPGFTGTMALIAPEVWLPLGVYDAVIGDIFRTKATGLADRSNPVLFLAGRFAPGITEELARASVATTGRQLEQAFPVENRNHELTLQPLARMGASTRPEDDSQIRILSALLLSMSAVVLFIACLNLANMLLARGTARQREIAIRIALGGSRRHIVGQLLSEGLVLAAAGSAGGLLLAYWSMRLLVASLTPVLPIVLSLDAAPDVRVLAAATALAVVSTIAFGLGPALRLSRADVVEDLKDHASAKRDGVFGRVLGARNLLVVGQIALSLALLAAGGLFARGALNAATEEPFRLSRQLLVAVDPGLAGYSEQQGRTSYRTLLERLRRVPGVESLSMASLVPYGDLNENRVVRKPGDALVPDRDEPQQSTRYTIVGSQYFATLGVPILRGREFTSAEEGSATPSAVAVIDQPLARRLFGDEDPIGRSIEVVRSDTQAADALQVVGLVPWVKGNFFDTAERPHVYVPFGRSYRSNMNLHVRVGRAGSESNMLAALRRELRDFDDRLPVLSLSTMAAHRDRSLPLWGIRTGGRLFTLFGVLALLLASIGVYGLKAYVVSRRTREFGIRMALGARPADVLWMVMREGAWLTGAGVAAGLFLAAAVGQLLSGLLYGVRPLDPIVFTIAPAALAAAALLACYLPARRATRVVPVTALRTE